MRKKFIAAAVVAVLLPFSACERKSAQRIKQAELCMRERAHLGPDVKIKIDGEADARRVTLSSANGLERLPSVKEEWNKSRFKATERIYLFDPVKIIVVDGIEYSFIWTPARIEGEQILGCLQKGGFVTSNNITALSRGPIG